MSNPQQRAVVRRVTPYPLSPIMRAVREAFGLEHARPIAFDVVEVDGHLAAARPVNVPTRDEKEG